MHILLPFGTFSVHYIGIFLLWTLDIFCGHSVYYSPFWCVVPRKIWQPCRIGDFFPLFSGIRSSSHNRYQFSPRYSQRRRKNLHFIRIQKLPLEPKEESNPFSRSNWILMQERFICFLLCLCSLCCLPMSTWNLFRGMHHINDSIKLLEPPFRWLIKRRKKIVHTWWTEPDDLVFTRTKPT
jgi:hypothetical protein